MISYLRVGKITTTHGIKGELKVFATTDDLRRYDTLKEVYMSQSEEADDAKLSDSRSYEIVGVKYVKNSPVIKLKDVDTIEAATLYIGKSIYVKRDEAIALDKNEYYISDLIGLEAYVEKQMIGKVTDIMKTKAQSILVIDVDGRQKLVPLVYDFIEKIDLDEKSIYLKTIEGLL